MDDERLCDCGDCRHCNAYLSSDFDYDDAGCLICVGAGCPKCETED